MQSIITTKNLSKQYNRVYRVKDVNLNVAEGAVYGFLGPNGAGKTTTLKMILGLTKATSGSIDVFGRPLNSKNRLEILRNVGSLIESPSYYGHLTGEENLKITQQLLNVPEKNIRKALEIVRLVEHKDKKAGQYSLGMKQRLGLAAAIMGFPKLLILDEPTNGLDPAGIQEMRELIKSLPKEYGITVVVSSHLLTEIDQMATSVGIINDGQLVFQNKIETLRGLSEKSIAVRTQDNNMAKRMLDSKGIEVQTKDDYLLFNDYHEQQVVLLNRILVESNIGVLRIEEWKTSLEDIFLEMTGKAASL